jgi:GNAT superfamily N-acetyltransferase
LWHSAAVSSRLRRYRRFLRTHGARGTAAEIARRLGRLFGERERLIVLRKELDAITAARPTDLRMEDLRADHLADLGALNRRRGARDADSRFARYLQQGFEGFVGYRGEELVGYYWWVDSARGARFPDLREKQLGIGLGEKDVYGSDFFLLEEHRGGGVAAAFLWHIETAIHDRGFERLWGYVLSENRPARWIYRVRGYEPMWIVSRRRVGPFWRTTREPLA